MIDLNDLIEERVRLRAAIAALWVDVLTSTVGIDKWDFLATLKRHLSDEDFERIRIPVQNVVRSMFSEPDYEVTR
jgi:hypothetical protein